MEIELQRGLVTHSISRMLAGSWLNGARQYFCITLSKQNG